MLGGERGQFFGRYRVIRPYPHRDMLTHRPRRTQGGPGAAHTARVHLERRDFSGHFPNGFFAERSISRTGTAPKPSSRLMPLIRYR